MTYLIDSYIEASGHLGHDALSVINFGDACIVALADGAGGGADGEASRIFVESSRTEVLEYIQTPDEAEHYLRNLDQEILAATGTGATTAVLVVMRRHVVIGASVGDSQCWLLATDFDYQLTGLQHHKPLLGSGCAQPVGFGPMNMEGMLLAGSNGLFKYTTLDKIKIRLAAGATAMDIVNLAREDTGYLQDDACALLCNRQAL